MIISFRSNLVRANSHVNLRHKFRPIVIQIESDISSIVERLSHHLAKKDCHQAFTHGKRLFILRKVWHRRHVIDTESHHRGGRADAQMRRSGGNPATWSTNVMCGSGAASAVRQKQDLHRRDYNNVYNMPANLQTRRTYLMIRDREKCMCRPSHSQSEMP